MHRAPSGHKQRNAGDLPEYLLVTPGLRRWQHRSHRAPSQWQMDLRLQPRPRQHCWLQHHRGWITQPVRSLLRSGQSQIIQYRSDRDLPVLRRRTGGFDERLSRRSLQRSSDAVRPLCGREVTLLGDGGESGELTGQRKKYGKRGVFLSRKTGEGGLPMMGNPGEGQTALRLATLTAVIVPLRPHRIELTEHS